MKTPGFLAALWIILLKDLKSEARSKQTIATMALFGLVLAFIFAFGFVADPMTNLKVMPGALWGSLLFTGTLGVGRTFAQESQEGAFAALVLSPAPRSAILLAKVLMNFILTLLVMVVVTPVLAVMLHVDLSGHAGIIALQIALGSLAFAAVGTPLAVVAVNARFAEVLLPMVIFPMLTPVLIAGVKATGIVLGTTVGIEPWPWMHFMVAFIVFFGTMGLFLFDRMVTE